MGCGPAKDEKKEKPGKPEEKRPAVIRRASSQKQETLKQKIASTFSARWAAGKMSEIIGIRERYKLLDIVGHGRYGVVYKAESKTVPPRSVAIKIVKVNNEEEKNFITQEIKVLKALDHPNIVKYYEQFEEGPYVFVVTEYCSGGELFDRISEQEFLKESEAVVIFQKLLRALNHCHKSGIIHRDIKPENIMYSTLDPGSEIKLIDFGLADEIKSIDPKNEETVVGTLHYISPEMMRGLQNECSDIWALGVVLHIMLSGLMPFGGETARSILHKILEAKLNFDTSEWDNVSEEGKDLVKRMVEPDITKRLTASDALDHAWFNRIEMPPLTFLEKGKCLVSKIREFKIHSRFQQCVLNIFVKTLSDEELSDLTETFHRMDKNQTGFISSQDLIEYCKKRYTESDIIELVSKFSSEKSKEINYTQFIAATMDTKHFLTNERLRALFQYFNVSNTEYITASDLRTVLNHAYEKEFSKEEVDQMLLDHDIHSEAQLNFEAFKKIMENRHIIPGEDMLDKVYEL